MVSTAKTMAAPSALPAQSRQAVRCSASQQHVHVAAVQTARRSLLLAVPLLAAGSFAKEASARWDGESAAIGSCGLDAEGAECRQQLLASDIAKLESYDSAIDNSKKTARPGGPGGPVSDKYASDTLAMSAKLQLYTELDPYDPSRQQLIKELKTEGSAWVGKYAKGGSARTASGRKVYIAIDSVQGHLASNGLAPYPPSKAAKLRADLEEAKVLLAQGR